MLNFGLLKSQAQKDADEAVRNILIAKIETEVEAKDKESSSTNSDIAVKEKGKKDVKTRNG